MPIALLKEKMPPVYQELHDTVKMLEKHFHDMQVPALRACSRQLDGLLSSHGSQG
jgi:hypothetical protein